jgi:hypothetical protein
MPDSGEGDRAGFIAGERKHFLDGYTLQFSVKSKQRSLNLV